MLSLSDSHSQPDFQREQTSNECFVLGCRLHMGVPDGASGKDPPANARELRGVKRHKFVPWSWEDCWNGKWQPTPVFLPGISHGKRSLVGYNPWGYRESDMTEHLIWSREIMKSESQVSL